MEKCKNDERIVIKPDGEHELDPCCYEIVKTLENVTLQILRCKKCGNIELSWKRQPDTAVIPDEEFEYM